MIATFPSLPNYHALGVMMLTVIALYLFRKESVPLETSSLLVIILLAVGFTLFPFDTIDPYTFFTGFGHEALVAVCALMIAGQGLVRTGALEPIGRMLAKLWKLNPTLSLLITLLVASLLSAFMNNTPIVVLLLPILISVSIRTGSSSSKILLPMGLGTLVGGAATTIGTSTNLLVVSIAASMGLETIGLFDFFVPAIIVGTVGITYLWLIAPKLIPARSPALTDTSPRIFNAHLSVEDGGFADGATVAEILEKTENHMRISRIRRGNVNVAPIPDTVLKAGDRLDVKDSVDNLKEFESLLGMALFKGNKRVNADAPLKAEGQQLAEFIIMHGSPLVDTTLGQVNFSQRYGLAAIALHRAGKVLNTYHRGIGGTQLEEGDVLLVQGSKDQLEKVKALNHFLVLDATTDLPHTKRAPVALGLLAMAIGLAALNILPIAISALCAVLLMILTKCLSWKDAANALNTQIILIVAASLALGVAMLNTGGAQYLAEIFVWAFQGASPPIVLSGLILLLAILTNIVSNNAAAVIGTPIAISVANQLGLPPEPFVIGVLFGANLSYATPMAYKTNVLVMSAGGYTFSDFVRIGLPLVLIMWIGFSVVLPLFYGLI